MNKFYHKLAVLSVCTALSFTLGINKGAKAATISLTPTYSRTSVDYNRDGQEDYASPGTKYVGIHRPSGGEFTSFYQFNIADLSLDSNTVISNAFFEGSINNIESPGHFLYSMLFADGYISENKVVDLGYILIRSLSPGSIFKFDATTFVNQIVKNGQSSAYFKFSSQSLYPSFISLENGKHPTTLTITTVDVAEPVPEPTTIFGSALALGVGGWLKRKKLSQENKTTPQH